MASQHGGRVAICGADDRVGGQIARRLVEEGVEVRALAAPDAPRWHLFDVAVDWHVGLRAGDHAHELSQAFAGCGALFIADAARLASGAPDASTARRIAVRELRMRLDAARAAQVPRVVFVSCERAFDPQAIEGAAGLPDDHGEPVREALIAMEAELYRYIAAGMHICIVAAALALGPGDVRSEYVGALDAGGAGWSGYAHFCDARDVAQAAINAARRGRAGRRYPFIGEAITAERFAELRREHGGGGSSHIDEVSWPPSWAIRLDALKSELAAGELGVRSRPLALTLRDAGRWYRRAGMLLF
ncbi:hypothetical protein FRC98_00705 [Lujinxingia vulgaris]|uniref:NAD-dependent epimerase/dehydratase domain-containing protein n=1 Tax=Lujinxingia vulgaris TaxID=2600176 RepID=A0A5C6XEJ7_9DELT|nr:NAD-dependent epimerase/dehydratase family protein [Lujinxingia vulgaris]TXD38953.1 hypothetical protein FRC98_00705 [Lujinxingia vulgaris]